MIYLHLVLNCLSMRQVCVILEPSSKCSSVVSQPVFRPLCLLSKVETFSRYLDRQSYVPAVHAPGMNFCLFQMLCQNKEYLFRLRTFSLCDP
ncbi:hypothetical protein CDAR_205261 [Caerostris darwini]|uniref:Secreted protein n=1 Tax=Caerostris darwini TaxID=1538125 RepID=A0AAV4WUJ6_9ARAC|nr:hypothetical protein CDAR_205261 [Caerostris darwini]